MLVEFFDDFVEGVFLGFEDQVGQQGDDITGSKVFSRFLVVFFIETPEKFFEDGAHPDIGKGGYLQTVGTDDFFIREIDAGIGDTFYDGKKAVVIGQLAGLGVVVEVLQNVTDILAVAIEVFGKIVVQEVVIVGGLGFQAVERPLAGVEIAEARDVLDGIFVQDLQLHFFLGFDFLIHFFLGGFEEGVQTAEYDHREYDITVLATEEYVAEHVVRNVPYEAHHLTMGTFHIFL